MQLLEHQLKTNQPNKQTSERESKLEKALMQQYLRKDCLERTGICNGALSLDWGRYLRI